VNRRIVAGLCLWVMASAALAGETITLELRDAQLADVIRMLTEAAGQNVIIDPAVTGQVSVSFRDIAPDEALASLLKTYNYAAIKDGKLMRIVRAAETQAEPKLEQRTFIINAMAPVELQQQLAAMISDKGKVVVSPEGRTVVVVDRPERLKDIESFLKAADTRRKQVMIEARILEVGLNNRDQLGFYWSWIYTKPTTGPHAVGTATQDLLPPEASEFQIALTSRHLDATLQALASRGYVNLLSSPKVAAVDGQMATMEVIEKLPYIQSTVAISAATAGASTTTSQQVEFEEVGVKLSVLPQIGADRQVLMKITPEVSEAPTRYQGIPVVSRRKAETQVVVADGEVVAIGGLIRENRVDEIRRVPILSAIPYIGKLFQSKDSRTIKTELLILIQPTIMDGAVPAAMTQQLQSRVDERHDSFRDRPDVKEEFRAIFGEKK